MTTLLKNKWFYSTSMQYYLQKKNMTGVHWITKLWIQILHNSIHYTEKPIQSATKFQEKLWTIYSIKESQWRHYPWESKLILPITSNWGPSACSSAGLISTEFWGFSVDGCLIDINNFNTACANGAYVALGEPNICAGNMETMATFW